jgi:23S rRNA pseudouridine2604 synthase
MLNAAGLLLPRRRALSVTKETMLRINKVLMKRLKCSRREADRYIKAGYVQVDGRVVTDLATQVVVGTTNNDSTSSSSSSSSSDNSDTDSDCYGSVRLTDLGHQEISKIQSDPYHTILFHKPLGVVSCQPDNNSRAIRQIPAIRLCTKDREHPKSAQAPPWYEPSSKTRSGPHHRPCPPQQQAGWSAAGRLDVNSSGLLVLTRSGAVASQILGNDADATLHGPIEKEYLVRIPQLTSDPSSVVEEKLRQLREGIVCPTDRRHDEKDTADAAVVAVSEMLTAVRVDRINENQVKFVLDRGRRHHLRRMCRAVQWDVSALKRVRIGNIRLGDLPVGFWRYLRPNEAFR